tara:strand:- start:1133 stop:1840 length:708 start_codon:yes stop_codon:yes gene_type:complete
MKRILGIIPARSGSKGLKNKNIKVFAGKPLIYWTIKEAKKVKNINKLIVSTDSKKIATIAQKYNVEVPFLRPKNISKDQSSSFELLRHAINYYKKKKIFFDYLVLLEPTSPLRTSKDINYCIEFVKKNKIKSLISVSKVKSQHPANLLKLRKNRKLNLKKNKFIPRRQMLESFFYPEGSIYISEINLILRTRTFYNKETCTVTFPDWKSFEIDDIKDFKFVENLFKIKNKLQKLK